jgi:hypothetical protein
VAVVCGIRRIADGRLGTLALETILFEKPFLIGLLGTITAVVLGFLWLQTGRRSILYILIATLVFMFVGIGIARYVVTDREAVTAALHQIAEAVERNDMPQVLRLIHPDSASVRAQAMGELPRYEFHEVNIKSNLEVTFDKSNDPTEAVAKFNVLVVGSERTGLVKNRRVPIYCSVTLRKHDNAWRMYAYEHSDPREGLLQR